MFLNKFSKKIRKENINSFLIAILVMSGLISFITNIENIIPIILITVFLTIEIINWKDTFEMIKNKKRMFPNTLLIACTIIVILYIASLCQNGIKFTILDRLYHFIGFLMIPCICCRHKISINQIIDSILIISTILSLPLMFKNFGKYDGGTRMSISYYMLPTYISIIMSFFVAKNNNLKLILGKCIYCLIVFYPFNIFLIQYASRGIYVAIAVCLFLCIIIKKSVKQKLLISAVTCVLVLIIAIFFKPLLIFTNKICVSTGINIEIITKNLKLSEEGKIGNGRDLVYQRAIDGIKDHPIIRKWHR